MLAAVGVLTTLPMLRYGSIARIEFDGWWHVYIARLDWAGMWSEAYRNAHPPIYYLLLKAATRLGSEYLVYRSVGIVAGAAATVAFGAALAHVARVRATGLLGAIAFGFATSTVIIANEVRSYMLASAFLLLALPPYLSVVRPETSRRARAFFATLIVFAFLSHYAILLVYVALLAVPVVIALLSRDFRRAWREALPRRWRADLATVSLPAIPMLVAYFWHMDQYRGPMDHLPDFYFSRDESLWRYIVESLVREIDLFSPFHLSQHGDLPRAAAIAIVLAIPALLLWSVRRGRSSPLVAVFPLALLLLGGIQLAASTVGVYPFGGSLRHQFFIFPFALSTLFLFLDRVLSRFDGGGRRVAVGALAIVVLGGAALQWRRLPMPRAPLFSSEMAVFRDAFPTTGAVYLDGFSLPSFFSHAHDWDWTVVDEVFGGRLEVFRVEKMGESFFVFRDQRHWAAGVQDPSLYRALRAGADATGVASVAIFKLHQSAVAAEPSPAGRERERERLAAAARAGGLKTRKVVHLGPHVFALLEVGESGEPPQAVILDPLELPENAIVAVPNPIQVCGPSEVGTAILLWRFPGRAIDIRVNGPAGKLWGSPPSIGSAATGPWVTDGMTFFVQDRDAQPPSRSESTLGTVVVRHTEAGCAARGRR